jgi:hypothetical protein
MSYLTQWQLTYDPEFTNRGSAAVIAQADIFKDAAAADQKALAESVLCGEGAPLATFRIMLGASPGFADKVDSGDGTIDSSLVLDDEILSTIQGAWPTVAALYFDVDGTPKKGS